MSALIHRSCIGDQRHHRRAGLREVADVGAQVGDHAARRREHVGVAPGRARPSRAPRARAAHLRVVVAGFAGGLLRLAQVGLGAANLAARLLARGLRDLEAAHRDRAGILLVQLLLAAGVAFGHVAVGLGRRQRRPRRLDAGRRAASTESRADVVGRRGRSAARSAYGCGSMSNSGWPGCTSSLLRMCTATTLPATSAATGTTKAWMRACEVLGVSRSPTKYRHEAGHDQHGDDRWRPCGRRGRAARRRRRGRRRVGVASAVGPGSWRVRRGGGRELRRRRRKRGLEQPLPVAALAHRGACRVVDAPAASGRPASRRPSPCRGRSGSATTPPWRGHQALLLAEQRALRIEHALEVDQPFAVLDRRRCRASGVPPAPHRAGSRPARGL